MGDINQYYYIESNSDLFEGPFLEIGSKDYGNTQDLRPLFKDKGDYTGTDMFSGKGVDIVQDMTVDFDRLSEVFDNKRFGTIFCLSVLEHCENPFKMAENITRLLKPGGHIVLSVPFCWQIHGYPQDFWRFTPQGIKKLFSEIDFIDEKSLACTSRPNDFRKIDEELTKITFSYTAHKKDGNLVRAVSAKLLKMLSKVGVLKWLTGYRYLFPATNIFAIGKVKK
ncbi:MAG: class I SAM-dependent methyltransferase [Planctomycetes bacterium]|nr:class I SAM-dependent methyltransferase [Planctomycetota bacterium]